ncbi:gamma-glutamylcyclotransferase [Rhizobium albus]|nr:gamma-glutamylcyclotransferase [Rhizobium albus]
MQDHPVDDGTLSRLAAEGALVAYFGYGSLVNRETLRTHIVGARPARVSGWRREWQPRPDAGLAADHAVHASLLTVRPAPESAIDGLLVFDHVDNLAAVDLRENDYQRRHVPLETLTVFGDGVPDGCPIYIYEADPPEESPEDCPILQSYLDAVLKGFLREHGLAGLQHFIRGTANFDTPILGDRDWPIYPRAVSLSAEDRALFDRLLQENGARYVA